MAKLENGMRKATERAIELMGGPQAAATKLGVARTVPYYWLQIGRIPPNRVLAVEQAVESQVTRYQLRPDVYGE